MGEPDRKPGRRGASGARGTRRGGGRTDARAGGSGGTGPGPRPPRTGARAKPPLPAARPRLPRDVFADVKASSASGEFEDVARALGAAERALEAGDPQEAVTLLEWAKTAAARSWAVREAIGIAYYVAGRYGDAHRELLAYRRLSGREDQNHLLADCARAAGQGEKARGYVEAMIEAGVGEDRQIEGLLVVAGERADRGDIDGALQTLGRLGADRSAPEPHHLRLWYMAAELHEQRGEHERAARLRQAIAEADPDFIEAMER